MPRVRYTEDSAPCERLRTQQVVDAEAWQAEISLLSKRERRNEVRSGRDRASIPDATPQCHTADFHLSQCANRHFTLCFQGRVDFHASKNGEPPPD